MSSFRDDSYVFTDRYNEDPRFYPNYPEEQLYPEALEAPLKGSELG